MSLSPTGPNGHPELLSLAEAAELLKRRPATLRQWMTKGVLVPDATSTPEVLLFRKQHVEGLLRRGRSRAPHDFPVHTGPFPVVAIGASAEDASAVQELLDELPTDLGAAYVVIVTGGALPPDALRTHADLPVLEAADSMLLEPDRVYLTAADAFFTLNGRSFHRTRARSRPFGPIDAFMNTLARDHGSHAVAIVLSGRGDDGTAGARAVKAEGGLVVAQDDSATLPDMPMSLRETGLVDLVLRPSRMGRALGSVLKQLYVREGALLPAEDEEELRRILLLLRQRQGVDFTQYKHATINRRILRRMALSKHERLSTYRALLEENPAEVEVLHNDLLINVTSFFRDPLVFRSLTRKVLPALLKDRKLNDPMRIWVAGCAGGEEVVSFAITILEHLEGGAVNMPVQIFATDLNERSIEKARVGIYKRHAVQGLSPERIKRFFMPIDGHYQVIKAIRDMCVFARHDLLNDPPFSRMDLISCQNVLIYLENSSQSRVLRSFHYALKPSGFLLLGKSESTTCAADHFAQMDREHKVYTRREHSSPPTDLDLPVHSPIPAVASAPLALGARTRALEFDLDKETDSTLLKRYVPASVVVNKDLQIVRFRGPIADFLGPTTGKVSWSILKMVRDDLAFEVRSLLMRAGKERTATRKSGIPVDLRGTLHDITLEVIPLPSTAADPYRLVVFRDEGRALQAPSSGSARGRAKADPHERRIALLEQELRETREHMRIMGEEAEEIHADLQSANEEVVSSNEELQSMNEELETSKEELQSINEEFATANEELQRRNDALHESEARYRELIRTMPVAVYTCDAEGHLRLYNQAAVELWGREPVTGRERWCGSERMHRPNGEPLPLDECPMAIAIKERRSLRDVEAVVERPDGSRRQVLANPQPMFDADGVLIGAVNVLTDITDRKSAQASTERLAAIVDSSQDAIISEDLTGRVTSWNKAAEQMYGYAAAEIVGRSIAVLIPGDRRNEEQAILARIKQGLLVEHYETERIRKDGTAVPVSLSLAPLRDDAGEIVGASKIARDISERKRTEDERLLAQQRLARSEERFHRLADSMVQLAWMADPSGRITWLNRRWSEFTGLGLEQLMDDEVRKGLHHDEHRDRIADIVQRHVDRKEAWEFVFPYLRHDGEYRWFLSRSVPVMDGEGRVVGWYGTNTDITEQKVAEDALHENDRRKDEFLAVLAHELRNPLAPLRSGLQLMSDPGGDPVARDETVAIMHRQVEQLVRLVDDLLDLSRINQGRIELRRQPLDLREAARNAVETSRPLMQRQGQHLELDMPEGPMPVDGDPTRLAQVIANLLNNASKYTPPGGHIRLVLATEGEHAVVTVSDDGIGISADMLEKVFDMFTQAAPGRSHSGGGLGIGLNIVKRLVYLHGGTISAFSAGPGQGSVFSIRLRMREQPPPAPLAERPASAGITPKRVLVVDDNEDIVMTTRLLLTKLGHTVRVAYNGQEALAQAEAFRPDIVLMDIGLPVMDGYEAARTLRQQPWGKDIKLVAITGWGQARDIENARDAGFDRHLVKPVERKQLEALLAD